MCSEIPSFLSPRLLKLTKASKLQKSDYFKLDHYQSCYVRSICTPPRGQQTRESQNWLKSPQNGDNFWNDSDAAHKNSNGDVRPKRRGRLASVDTPSRKPWLSDGVPKYMNDLIVGKGGFGTVVKALYKGEEVAVKVVKKHRRGSLKSLDNEKNGVELKHPNLVKISTVVNEERHTFGLVLMENCPSTSLQQIIDNPDFEINYETRLRYLIDVSKALSYCHEQGIIHLDVKPRNVLVILNTNQSKLCDFGMSKRIDSTYESDNEYSGTVAYSAPELFCRQTPTIKCDVYSYGILMWQLQTRETPYYGLDQDTVIYKVVSQSLRPFPIKTNKIEEGHAEIYESCWHAHPSHRPTIHEVALKLYVMIREIKNKIIEKIL